MQESHKSQLLNVIIVIGLLLYFGTQGLSNIFSVQDLYLKGLAFSIMYCIQIIRGLCFFLNAPVPQWFVLKKMDKPFLADCAIVFALTWLVLELTLRGVPLCDEKGVDKDPLFSNMLIGFQIIFGTFLLYLSIQKSSKNIGVSIGLVVFFMVIFAAPILLAAGVGWATYSILDLQGDKDLEMLIVSLIIPLTISSLWLVFKDKKDRAKNTMTVIKVQLATLPAIPLCFFALKNFWPKDLSVIYFPMFLMVPILIAAAHKRKATWLLKEQILTLHYQFDLKKKNVEIEVPDFQTEIEKITTQIVASEQAIKTNQDRLDRAETYWLVGELQYKLEDFSSAEGSYNKAISAYNDVLQVDKDNRFALANKFKAVERLSEIKRIRLIEEEKAAEHTPPDQPL